VTETQISCFFTFENKIQNVVSLDHPQSMSAKMVINAIQTMPAPTSERL